MHRNRTLFTLTSAVVFGLVTAQASAQEAGPGPNVTIRGPFAIYTAPAAELARTNVADIANAKAMPLPQATSAPVAPGDEAPPPRTGTPRVVPGKAGSGQTAPVTVPLDAVEQDAGVEPQEFGTSNHPFTTARVDTASNNVSRTFPYSAAGKLYFRDGAGSFVCSASLIRRGIVVTAAHCVSRYGQRRFYTNFQFVPGKYNAIAPFGTWTGGNVIVMTSYFAGTDVCAPGATGVVCQNDIAVIAMVPQAGAYPGTRTGWLGYGTDGFGFTPTNLALINQLGYPVSHDAGNIMQRTDSEGFVSTSMAGNTVWGSRQTGGSSGGPEVVNLGTRGALSTTVGAEGTPNVVVGVTSWGYVSAAIKQQGASPFRATNIVALVNAICAGSNPACR